MRGSIPCLVRQKTRRFHGGGPILNVARERVQVRKRADRVSRDFCGNGKVLPKIRPVIARDSAARRPYAGVEEPAPGVSKKCCQPSIV